MRRRDTTVRPLRGQLVFVELEGAAIHVDCLLSRSWDEPGAPASLQVKLPGGRSSAPARTMLRRWAEEGVPIEVTIANDRRGAVVSFSTPTGEIVFEPYDADEV